MASNNMASLAIDPDVEDERFAREVEQVKTWWRDSRWRFTKRPFTAEQIVSKRGHLQVEYASNVQAKKLWGILEERFKVGALLMLKVTFVCHFCDLFSSISVFVHCHPFESHSICMTLSILFAPHLLCLCCAAPLLTSPRTKMRPTPTAAWNPPC